MEKWLTGTVPGIVILGAVGSLLALAILWTFRLIPVPWRWHRKRQTRQAFMLGYSAATIERDETGRSLVAFLFYHLSLLMIYLAGFSFCGIVFLIILGSQSEIALTSGAFFSSAAAFTLAYLAYFEFEYVFRTYLFYWKVPLQRVREHYRRREAATDDNCPREEESGDTELNAPPVRPYQKN